MKIGPNPNGIRVDSVPPQGASVTDTVRSSADPVVRAEPVASVSFSKSSPAMTGKAAEPPFDSAKVEEMKRALAEGRFPLDARKVAEGLIAHAREMMERTRPVQ